jgi:hypothetical protein
MGICANENVKKLNEHQEKEWKIVKTDSGNRISRD